MSDGSVFLQKDGAVFRVRVRKFPRAPSRTGAETTTDHRTWFTARTVTKVRALGERTQLTI